MFEPNIERKSMFKERSTHIQTKHDKWKEVFQESRMYILFRELEPNEPQSANNHTKYVHCSWIELISSIS